MHSNPSSEVFRCTLQVVYMDEPSTGLDPASRYNLWNVVKESKQNRAIILTSMFLIPFSVDLLTYLFLLIGYEGLLRSIT
jgi:ABC-type transporter Mla maintaining outer membrane lipid asymmetry ATPase subunit MlaF